jgi:UDP-glucuronate decarboxylase
MHFEKKLYHINNFSPRSCYDEGKRVAESLIYEYRKKHSKLDKKLKIVRIFNTYGPKMDISDGRVVANFI